MGEDDQNPNTLRDFRLTKIRFLKSSSKRSKNTGGGGVKAVWKKSKHKQFSSLSRGKVKEEFPAIHHGKIQGLKLVLKECNFFCGLILAE